MLLSGLNDLILVFYVTFHLHLGISLKNRIQIGGGTVKKFKLNYILYSQLYGFLDPRLCFLLWFCLLELLFDPLYEPR